MRHSTTSIVRSLAVLALIMSAWAVFFAPPIAYPLNTVIHIEEGSTVSDVADMLVQVNAVSYAFSFKLVSRAFGGGVLAGSYALSVRESTPVLAYRLARGNTGLEAVKVTIPEGSTVRDIAAILDAALLDFDAESFRSSARDAEGYLFPDTYFFLPGTPPSSLVSRMRDTFDGSIKTFVSEITASGHTLHEIVTMASLIEKEARQTETRRIVSGILWKRIDRDMPLQVDAVFGYIFDRDTYSPSFDDLKVDSPYNTYTNIGLPPGPIANPGLDSLEAALRPIETPYWYYLTGSDGAMHYARTFEEHVANRAKLR